MPSVNIVETPEEAAELLKDKFLAYYIASGGKPEPFDMERAYKLWLAGLIMGLDQNDHGARCLLGAVAVHLISGGKSKGWVDTSGL
jgi:hypothetical protein